MQGLFQSRREKGNEERRAFRECASYNRGSVSKMMKMTVLNYLAIL
jgi:hypothetical protein